MVLGVPLLGSDALAGWCLDILHAPDAGCGGGNPLSFGKKSMPEEIDAGTS